MEGTTLRLASNCTSPSNICCAMDVAYTSVRKAGSKVSDSCQNAIRYVPPYFGTATVRLSWPSSGWLVSLQPTARTRHQLQRETRIIRHRCPAIIVVSPAESVLPGRCASRLGPGRHSPVYQNKKGVDRCRFTPFCGYLQARIS